jgi:hypothetical protein
VDPRLTFVTAGVDPPLRCNLHVRLPCLAAFVTVVNADTSPVRDGAEHETCPILQPDGTGSVGVGARAGMAETAVETS